MGLLLHTAAACVIFAFVWATLQIVARRVPRAGQVESALWLLGSDRAAPWWKNQPMITAALTDAGKSLGARIPNTVVVALGALAAAAAMWAAVSWRDFLSWYTLLRESPQSNATLITVPAAFVLAGVHIVLYKSDRTAASMARARDARLIVAWATADLAITAVVGLLGWMGFLAAMIVSGREQELSHLVARASAEAAIGWQTGLSLAADRRGWPSWGVWYYAIVLAGLLPWIHGAAACTLRAAVGHARSLVERVDQAGMISLENKPLAAIATIAALLAAGGYALMAIVS